LADLRQTTARPALLPPRRRLGNPLAWSLFALVLVAAPRLLGSGLAVTLLSQMGVAIIACLSCNILLGQGGMLSFGHAVYSGLGGFVAIHALNLASRGELVLPVSLVPLVGGLAGMGFAALLGFVTTRTAGHAFAMITLGLGELVFAAAVMFPGFFGGEAGVSANRVVGAPFLGISFGPAVQVYYLIAAYTLASTLLMYAFTQTPLGMLLTAVRDNPERVAFIGYDPHRVRYLAFIVAGFFAGIAGGLGALNFEIVQAEALSTARSGAYLLFTFLGGAGYFFGPILGGVLMVLCSVLLSELTRAWLLYLGLAFMLTVMFAPGGLASLIMLNWQLAQRGRLRALWPAYAGLLLSAMVALAGAAVLIELIYHRQLNPGPGVPLRFLGLLLDSASAMSWWGALLVMLCGAWPLAILRRRLLRQCTEMQGGVP
jgi:branched-chain amino acid transport system permease protein